MNTKNRKLVIFSNTKQLITGVLSGLLIFQSVSPAWAGGSKKKLLSLKSLKKNPLDIQLTRKLQRQVFPKGMNRTGRIKINGKTFTLNPVSTSTAAALKKQPPEKYPLQAPADLGTADLAPVPPAFTPATSSSPNNLLIQLDTVLALLQLGTPEARKEAFAILLPPVQRALERVEEMGKDIEGYSYSYDEIESFLEQAIKIFSTPNPTLTDIQYFYQMTRVYSDSHIFPRAHVRTDFHTEITQSSSLTQKKQELEQLSSELEQAYTELEQAYAELEQAYAELEQLSGELKKSRKDEIIALTIAIVALATLMYMIIQETAPDTATDSAEQP